MKVYLLEHAYAYGENLEHTEVKTLGIYESREKDEKAISEYKLLPGFNEYDRILGKITIKAIIGNFDDEKANRKINFS